jgi:hypothetical protein
LRLVCESFPVAERQEDDDHRCAQEMVVEVFGEKADLAKMLTSAFMVSLQVLHAMNDPREGGAWHAATTVFLL